MANNTSYDLYGYGLPPSLSRKKPQVKDKKLQNKKLQDKKLQDKKLQDDRLRIQVTDLHNKNDMFSNENDKLQDEKLQDDRLRIQVTDLHNENDILSNENDKLVKKMGEAFDRGDNYKTQSKEFKGKLQEQTLKNKTLEDHNRRLEMEQEELKAKYEVQNIQYQLLENLLMQKTVCSGGESRVKVVRKRTRSPERDMDFEDRNFRDSDFRDSDFRDSDFRDSDFRDSNFRDSDFRDSDFRERDRNFKEDKRKQKPSGYCYIQWKYGDGNCKFGPACVNNHTYAGPSQAQLDHRAKKKARNIDLRDNRPRKKTKNNRCHFGPKCKNGDNCTYLHEK
jgi:uncharacterized protein YjbI with pentapeptide repeats